MQSQTEIMERYNERHKHLSTKHLQDEFGFGQVVNTTTGKQKYKQNLPYFDKASLAKVRNTGRWLSTKPTVIAGTEKLISFVIKNGHGYSVGPRRHDVAKRKLASLRKNASVIEESIDFNTERLCWFEIQVESYRRLIRDGEFFRQIWGSGDDLDVTFIEPEWICQPEIASINQIINLDEIPESVLDLQEFRRTRKMPGVLGIVFDKEDARKVLGYWEHFPNHFSNGTDGWMWHPESRVQHMKDGVDKADPRGVPRFYWALCNLIAIDEVNCSMVDLALVQAEHAALYKFDALSSTQQQISDIANNRVQRQDHNEGRAESPSVKFMRGMDIEIPGMKISAKDFIEVIQQQQRFAGGVSDIPEHMITSDANTGNRSSLVSAEGPFDRRVQREQIRMFRVDKVVLWRLLPAELEGLIDQREYQIVPDFPVAASRDAHKEVGSEVSLVEAKLKSKKQSRKALGIDHARAEAEIEEEKTLPSAPDPVVTGDNNTTDDPEQPNAQKS